MWSKTKKQLEAIICDSLRERVEFHCFNYRMHDGIGRTYINRRLHENSKPIG